jgi:hypothetical protein
MGIDSFCASVIRVNRHCRVVVGDRIICLPVCAWRSHSVLGSIDTAGRFKNFVRVCVNRGRQPKRRCARSSNGANTIQYRPHQVQTPSKSRTSADLQAVPIREFGAALDGIDANPGTTATEERAHIVAVATGGIREVHGEIPILFVQA